MNIAVPNPGFIPHIHPGATQLHSATCSMGKGQSLLGHTEFSSLGDFNITFSSGNYQAKNHILFPPLQKCRYSFNFIKITRVLHSKSIKLCSPCLFFSFRSLALTNQIVGEKKRKREKKKVSLYIGCNYALIHIWC